MSSSGFRFCLEAVNYGSSIEITKVIVTNRTIFAGNIKFVLTFDINSSGNGSKVYVVTSKFEIKIVFIHCRPTQKLFQSPKLQPRKILEQLSSMTETVVPLNIARRVL